MSRPRVLLLHAFPLDARMWEPQRRALEQAGYYVDGPDFPGDTNDVGFAAWAERVLREVAGDGLVVVGCSMGGYLAFELWRQAATRIQGFVLADTRATPDTPEQREARDENIRLLREQGFGPFWAGLAPKLFAPDADPAVVAGARALGSQQDVESLVTALETLRDRPDSTATLATIDVPTLVIVGEQDALTPPSDAAELEDGIRRSRLVRFAGAGHLTPLERPDDFSQALLAFLQEIAA